MKIYLGVQPAEHKTVLEPYHMEKEHMNLLMTYYKPKEWDLLKDYENTHLMIDSGAFTFNMKNKVNPKKVNDYSLKYRKFVKQVTDDPRVDGIFDLDILPLGEENILLLREKLFEVSDKIIPVWHREYGIRSFMDMCKKYNYVAITAASGDEIQQKGLIHFVKYAHKNNCKIHALGMTTRRVLDRVPFDSTDSMTWVNSVIYSYYDMESMNGKKRVRLQSDFTRNNRQTILRGMFLKHLEMAEYYYNKWRWYHND